MIACFNAKTKSLLFVFLIAVLSVFSCRKDEVTEGAELIGARNPFDLESASIDLQCFTTIADSVPTRRLTLYSIGVRNDVQTGITAAHIITQVSLPVNQFSFGPDFTQIDSVVLQVVYGSPTAYYGKLTSTQSINLYELNEGLIEHPDSQYFSNRLYKHATQVAGNFTGNFNRISDSVTVVANSQTLRIAPHLRVPITDPVFIAKLANGESTGIFANNTAFQSAIKGFIIKAEASPAVGEGAIAYMNLNNVANVMAIYYNGGKMASFPLSVNTVRANSFVHSFSPALQQQIQPSFSQTFSDVNYLQGLTALKTRVMIPGLFDLVKDHTIAIANAELVFKIVEGSNAAPNNAPDQIFVQNADSLGRNELIRDILENPIYYGGRFDATKGEYRFNINRHIQYLLNQYLNNNRNVNYGLNLLIPADNPVSAARVMLNMTPGSAKLNLTYTVIK
jgi:hypothetical protein